MWKELIRETLENLAPSKGRVDDANRRAAYVQGVLENDRDFGALEVTVSGSFAKNTAIAPLDDIDLAVYLDAAAWTTARGDPLSASTVLARVRERLEQTYRPHLRRGDVTLYDQPHSVGIQFAKEDAVSIDVVPLLWDGNKQHQALLPERGTKRLILTSIPRQARMLERRDNEARSLTRAIRLLKAWKRGTGARLRSCVIEHLAAHVVDRGAALSTRAIFGGVLRFIAESELRSAVVLPDFFSRSDFRDPREPVVVMDVANPENNMADNLDAASRRAAVAKAVRAVHFLGKAERAIENGSASAPRWWISIFGDEFS